MPKPEFGFTKGVPKTRDKQFIALLERTLHRVVRAIEEPRTKPRLAKASRALDEFQDEREWLEKQFGA